MGCKFISAEQSIAAAGAALVWQEEDDQVQIVQSAFMIAAFWSLILLMRRMFGQ